MSDPTVGVVIATFGEWKWQEEGADTCLSIEHLPNVDNVIHIHGDDLASARNQGAKEIGTDYIVFLDADDFLCDDYVNVLKENLEPGNVLYQPQTIAWFGDDKFEGRPEFIPDRNMSISNNLVIGTAVTSRYGVEFDSTLPALEDWDFFLRMISLGARVKQVPGMIYYVGINENSRNNPTGDHNKAYQMIMRKNIQVANYLLEVK